MPEAGAAERRRTVLSLGLIILVAAAVRIGTADYALWYDELASLSFARQPLGLLWSDWMLRETNPPLYYSMLRGWIALFGDTDPAVRLLSVAIGMAGLPAIFLLGRAIGDARAGLLAAVLLALSAIHADLSQQARAYGLAHSAVLFACLGMVGYLQGRSGRALLLYFLAAAAALYAHTTLVLFVGLANLVMLWALRRDRRALTGWVLVNALLLAVWAWWGWISLRQLMMPRPNFDWIVRCSPLEAWRMTEIVYLPFYERGAGPLGDLLLLLFFGAAAAVAIRRARPEVTLLAVLTIGTPLTLFLVSQHTPIFLTRTLSWANGPAIALLALAVTRIASPPIARGVAALLIACGAIGLLAWLPYREREQWPSAVAALERAAPRQTVLVADDAVALAVDHYRRPGAGLRIIVVGLRGVTHERWAAGLYPGPHVSPEGARALFGAQGDAAVLAWGLYDPGTLFAGAGKATSIADDPRGRPPGAILWRRAR